MVLSNTDMKYIMYAANEADKSQVLMRHGSVAVLGGKIMGRGHNHYRSTSKDAFITNSCTCHAEIASLRDMFHCCGSNAYGKHNNSIKGG
jgi:tRNA(Arg) A34 adenosine deaminase TadA